MNYRHLWIHENAIPDAVHHGIETLGDFLRREGERVGLRSETAPTTYWSYDEDEKPHRDPAYMAAYNPRRVSGATYRPYAGDSDWVLAANAAMRAAANANYPQSA